MRIILTEDIVRRLWDHMEKSFGSHRARKEGPEMRTIANMLDEMGVLDGQDFLRRYTTTLGRTIYTPFEIGVPSPGYDLAAQARTCVHEHQHVQQFLEGGPRFSLDYLTDSAHRAAYETEAMKCNLEVHFWLTGKLLDVAAMARGLKYYACTDDDIVVVTRALSMIAKTVEKGGVSSDAGKVAIKWFNELTVS